VCFDSLVKHNLYQLASVYLNLVAAIASEGGSPVDRREPSTMTPKDPSTPPVAIATEPLPYWQVNVDPALRTVECPPYLLNLSVKDVETLSTPVADFEYISWPEAATLIEENRLDELRRVPTDLRRYREHMHFLKAEYSSVLQFVLAERLHWTDTVARSPTMFVDSHDWKILINDWPYAWEHGVVHFVVWVKHPIPEEGGKVALAAKAAIDAFVAEKFALAKEIMWFKNGAAIKSIHEIEHFHVLARDVNPETVKKIIDDQGSS
jgi:hypothetical protein